MALLWWVAAAYFVHAVCSSAYEELWVLKGEDEVDDSSGSGLFECVELEVVEELDW